jgi:hypothetical protein
MPALDKLHSFQNLHDALRHFLRLLPVQGKLAWLLASLSPEPRIQIRIEDGEKPSWPLVTPEAPFISITGTSAAFEKIHSGQLTLAGAFMRGEIKIFPARPLIMNRLYLASLSHAFLKTPRPAARRLLSRLTPAFLLRRLLSPALGLGGRALNSAPLRNLLVKIAKRS